VGGVGRGHSGPLGAALSSPGGWVQWEGCCRSARWLVRVRVATVLLIVEGALPVGGSVLGSFFFSPLVFLIPAPWFSARSR